MQTPKARPVLLAYLYATLTQGSADAFVQAAIATPFTGVNNLAGRVKEILIEWGTSTQGLVPAISATSRAEATISRKSLAAIPDITAPSLVIKQVRTTALSTNGGAFDGDGVHQILYTDANAPIMAEANWYAQLDSNNSGIVNVTKVRIGYELVEITTEDKNAIIAAALQ